MMIVLVKDLISVAGMSPCLARTKYWPPSLMCMYTDTGTHTHRHTDTHTHTHTHTHSLSSVLSFKQ
jgi:hypothetical protein